MKTVILSHPGGITKWVSQEGRGEYVRIHGVALHKREIKTLKERRGLTKEEMKNLLTKGVKRRARMCPLWLTSVKVRKNLKAMHHTQLCILGQANRANAWLIPGTLWPLPSVVSLPDKWVSLSNPIKEMIAPQP